MSFPEMGVPICAANLNVGDSLSTVELIVDDTLIRNYPSVREKLIMFHGILL